MRYSEYSELYLKKCEKPEHVCDTYGMNSSEAICSPYYTKPRFYPGEYCRNSSECYTNNCNETTKKCIGKEFEDSCTKDAECNPGLFCLKIDEKTGKCNHTQKLNDHCDENSKCGSNMVCEKNNCTLIGSKKNGVLADNKNACLSFFIISGKCAPGPKLQVEMENNQKKSKYVNIANPYSNDTV